MANTNLALILALTCISTFMHSIHSKPVKRSATDCYGTDCVIPQHELDFNSNPRDTELLENITGAMTNAFPVITDLLTNIAHAHQNSTSTATASFSTLQRVADLLEDQAERQDQLIESVALIVPLLTNLTDKIQKENLPPSCIDVYSGQHTILPRNSVLGSFPVVCDMSTDGGRWIVFQRRYDGSVNFDTVWDDYENGFGSLEGEFWLGLRKLHEITKHGRWELRVDLEDFDASRAYAVYDSFNIGDAASFYRLAIGGYSGTAGDSMRMSSQHDLNGMSFSTKDQDHDPHSGLDCAVRHRGAWWHRSCTNANLNGLYLGQTGYNSYTGMGWYYWKNSWEVLKKSELKIRLIEG